MSRNTVKKALASDSSPRYQWAPAGSIVDGFEPAIRALRASSLADSVERLAERARAESWTHEEFLAACLQREVAARESHGGKGRIRAAELVTLGRFRC